MTDVLGIYLFYGTSECYSQPSHIVYIITSNVNLMLQFGGNGQNI